VPKSRKDLVVWTNSISPGFFVTMETPFIAGRDFNEHDTLRAPLVAVVNESMAGKFFGSPLSALGKTFRNGWNEISGPIQIIGVVKDAKYNSLRAEGEAIAYYPLAPLLFRLTSRWAGNGFWQRSPDSLAPWRWGWPSSGSTASCRTTSRGAAMKSAFAWRWARSRLACSA
jgi:hypothetical protein